MSSKYGHISNKTTTNHRSYPYSLRFDNQNDNNTEINSNTRLGRAATKNTSPFRHRDVNILQSSGLDSIENLIESRRTNNPHPYGTVEYRSYESQQIVFLKEKLIQTHNKLLRELEINNKLSQDIKGVEDHFRNSERKCRQMQQRTATLQSQLDQFKRILQRNQTKTQEKYKSVENRLESQSRKNYQLKQELELAKSQYMELTMQKNMLEEANTEFKVELKSLSETLVNLESEIKDRDDRILDLSRQLRESNQKWQRSQKQANELRYEIEQINNELNLVKSNQKELNHIYSLEKQKNQNLQHDVADLQGYTHQLQQKILSLEKQLEKSKQEFFWLKQNKETTSKTQAQHISKLTSDLETLNVMYKELQRELDSVRKKPIQDAQKKRRHYEITKEFVNQLENQQQLYGNSASRAVGFGNTNRTPVGSTNKLNRDPSPSGIGYFNRAESSNIEYFKNRNNSGANSYANLMTNKESVNGKQQRKNSQDKNKKLAELDAMLFNLNLQYKKIKTEIERIDTNSLKTREMIVKRKKLEEELNYQEEKIKKVKQDLRKLRVL